MNHDIDELLLQVGEIEKLLTKSGPQLDLNRVSVLAEFLAEELAEDGIALQARALKSKADKLATIRPGHVSIGLLKDAAFRIRISLEALKRSPPSA